MFGQVTQRYADALFDLARRKGALDAVTADVETLAREVGKEAVGRYLTNPRVDRAVRLAKLAPVVAPFHELTRNLVHLCFDKGREGVLLELGAAFRQRHLHESGAVEGVVESARPLGGAEVDRLAKHLSRRLGKTVRLENRVRPELIGGVRVTVGSSMIDATVTGRLAGLRERMLAAPLGGSAAN